MKMFLSVAILVLVMGCSVSNAQQPCPVCPTRSYAHGFSSVRYGARPYTGRTNANVVQRHRVGVFGHRHTVRVRHHHRHQ